MDVGDWDSVFQFIQPLDIDSSDRPLVCQIPTPPNSKEGSPNEDFLDGQTLVSVSTSFYPGSHIESLPPDLVMLSTDSVFFYVHSHIVIDASDNAFGSLITPASTLGKDQMAPVISVPESSTVLNIILHCIYNLSCAHYCHSFDALRSAINAMPSYGISVKSRIIPSHPLFNLLLSHAPLHPLDLYALAASHDLYEVAVSTSPHLLSFSLATLTDEMAERIGPVYLKRLFFLHFGRTDALKRLLLSPPHPHAPTKSCDFGDQKKLTRAWALASAYLAWDARPDLPASTMESALAPLDTHLTCDLCRHSLRERIKNLIVQWSVVKITAKAYLSMTTTESPKHPALLGPIRTPFVLGSSGLGDPERISSTHMISTFPWTTPNVGHSSRQHTGQFVNQYMTVEHCK